MRLPQSLAASEDDPSSPYISASTIRCKVLETVFTCGEQLAQSNEVENRETLPAIACGVMGSASPMPSWLKNDQQTTTETSRSPRGPAIVAEDHAAQRTGRNDESDMERQGRMMHSFLTSLFSLFDVIGNVARLTSRPKKSPSSTGWSLAIESL